MLAVAGVANSVNQPAINLFMADQVPMDRQGLAFGIKQSAIPAAVLISGLALPVLAMPLGWRATFAICAGLALAAAGLIGRAAPSFVAPPERPAAPRPSRKLVLTAVGAALGVGGTVRAERLPGRVRGGHRDRRGLAGVLAAAGSAVAWWCGSRSGTRGPAARLRLLDDGRCC